MSGAMIAEIMGSGVPVICLDTCSVLDLIRDPTKKNVDLHERKSALDMLIAAEGEKRLAVLLAEQVKLEYYEHVDRVEKEAAEAIGNLKAQVARVEAVVRVYGGIGTADLQHLDDHVKRARTIVDRWVAVAMLASQSSEIPSRALIRLNKVQTPAQKGKDSMKDCVVIETYLEVVHRLRRGGHVAPIVFASSNVKDYAEKTRSVPKPDLAAEFSALRMEYAPNLAAAKHHLGI